MAFLVEMLVPGVTREAYEQVDEAVEAAMGERGGPPVGLMLHVTTPVEGGLRVLSVFGTRQPLEDFYETIVMSAFRAAGLSPEPFVVSEVWTFARP